MYQLVIDEEARKALKRLPGHIRHRVARAIDSLKQNPRPADAKPLADELIGYWRLRIDNYRVIYTIDDTTIVVEVVRVDRRDHKTYTGLV
ncbi:MAG: type II toxin-antitoxin system RelE/ParE family toxin [Caldilinea sp. CFX5]|nr:type II toxin-antitoxin system RelE/ParE family toxin [Caldilinea sp. CFX5]